jgi:hypothetical protein
MKRSKRFAIVVLSAAAAACVTQPLVNEPLEWRPTSTPSGPVNTSDISHTRIQFGQFRDVRPNPELIAENNEDETPKRVTTNGDVGAFVGQHLRQLFDRAGLNTVDSGGDVIVTGEVRQFFVHETSTYKGDVAVHLVLRSRDGAVLWEGTASGTATRFGRSYELENYYEVLSDSLINANDTLMQDYDFRNALAKH